MTRCIRLVLVDRCCHLRSVGVSTRGMALLKTQAIGTQAYFSYLAKHPEVGREWADRDWAKLEFLSSILLLHTTAVRSICLRLVMIFLSSHPSFTIVIVRKGQLCFSHYKYCFVYFVVVSQNTHSSTSGSGLMEFDGMTIQFLS